MYPCRVLAPLFNCLPTCTHILSLTIKRISYSGKTMVNTYNKRYSNLTKKNRYNDTKTIQSYTRSECYPLLLHTYTLCTTSILLVCYLTIYCSCGIPDVSALMIVNYGAASCKCKQFDFNCCFI